MTADAEGARPRRIAVADLAGLVGERLGESGWHIVSQRQVDLFAEATGDNNPLHVDPVAAAAGPYGATIAHGFLTLSLVPALTAKAFGIDGAAALVNYGVNKVRFPAPLLVGRHVRLATRLAALEPAAGGVRLVLGFEIECRGSPRPVAVGETVLLVVTEEHADG